MTRSPWSIAPIFAVLFLALPVSFAEAQDTSHDDHHPPAAAGGDVTGTTAPDDAAKAQPASKPAGMGGMMGGDHMSDMMKMMKDMHGKMMGGDMGMQPKGDVGPSSLAFGGIAARMHRDMAITYTGNADVDFVKGMIPHHQAAVDMAKTVLAFGKSSDVKKVAEDVIKAQEAEIAWMKDWLKKQGQ